MKTLSGKGQRHHYKRICESFQTPWKIWNEIRYWLCYPKARFLFAFNAIPWGHGWRLHGTPTIQKHWQSMMKIGNGLQLRSTMSANPLGSNHPVILCTWQVGSVLRIGDNFAMTGGAICAAERIIIGNNVTVGANSTIIDTDFHPLDPDERRLQSQNVKASSIFIEDDVFIGTNCLILKGVWIGRGAVVGAGSVVTHDVPPGVIVAGNPAQVVATR